MPRDLKLIITDEQDEAALEHGDHITIEQVINDRLADLVQSASGVKMQKTKAMIDKLPDASKQVIKDLVRTQETAMIAAITTEFNKDIADDSPDEAAEKQSWLTRFLDFLTRDLFEQ